MADGFTPGFRSASSVARWRIPLYRRDGSVVAHALVDADLYEYLNRWRWCLDARGGYVVRTDCGPPQRTIRMHRVVMGFGPGDPDVDHKNRNKLDNRRENLRVSHGHHDNNQNQGLSTRNGSGFRGVSWDRRKERWRAQGQIGGHKRHLGYFAAPEQADEAARAFRAAHMPFSQEATHG